MALNDAQRQLFSKVPLLSGLTEGEMEFIANRATPRKYGPGQMVFSEGDTMFGTLRSGIGPCAHF